LIFDLDPPVEKWLARACKPMKIFNIGYDTIITKSLLINQVLFA